MPSEHPDSPPLQDDALQTKRCLVCQRSLNTDATTSVSYTPGSSESANFCSACRDPRLLARTAVFGPVSPRDIDAPLPPRRGAALRRAGSVSVHIDTHHAGEASSDDDGDGDGERGHFALENTHQLASTVPHGAVPIPIPASRLQQQQQQHPSHPQREPSPASLSSSSFRFSHPRSPVHHQAYSPASSSGEPHSPLSGGRDDDYPDPLTDTSRLRVRSKGYKCLYPGATFKGTQKSGRNSYDVNVTIVDVDFASSSLCGYLCIRGLTDDWPELTTYFDAQIIGMRHGFDTQDWGASRQEDMVHWARFPAFRAVQKDLLEPRLTLPANTSRPAVFMRWKERFLVPNHRVQDISGASFAGFYYVCVDFDPQPQTAPAPPQSLSQDMPLCVESGFAPYPADSQQGHGDAKRWSPSYRDAPIEEPAATMCGFYFHQNSEPYQQLSLTHVKDRFQSSFEFR